MELDKFTSNEINNILNQFLKVCEEKGYKGHLYDDIKNQGYGGFVDINDIYFIDLKIFPYPKFICFDLIEKYDSFILAGNTIKSYKLDNIQKNGSVLEFVDTSINELIKEMK